MNSYLGLGILLIAGIVAAKFLRRAHFPMVTAYLLLGVALGPYALNLVPDMLLNASGLISNIVLGIVAFTLGQSFSRGNLKELGKPVFLISIGEVVVSWALVIIALHYLLHMPLYLALLFGAIAPATAPAAIVMVVRECRAKGPLTNLLLGVVAIDDAWGLILFAVSLALSKALFFHTANAFSILILGRALLEVGGAFVVGAATGWLLSHFARLARSQDDLLVFTLGFIFATIGLAVYFGWSVLLACMVLGAFVANMKSLGGRLFDTIRMIDPPIYLLFFVLIGASLQIYSLSHIGLIGIVYFITRPLGEWLGAYAGAYISRTSRLVRRYLGLGLVPQAGVALGMALLCQSVFPEAGTIVLNVIIATTIMFELVGPFFTRIALSKAGEIQEETDRQIPDNHSPTAITPASLRPDS